MSQLILTGTSAEYHADTTHVSSSGLKLLLQNPAEYRRIYVDGEKQAEKNHFVEGTFVHALLLEPHTVQQNYAIFPGMRRAGKLWHEFEKENAGKIIITAPQMHRAEQLVNALNKIKIAQTLLACPHEHGMMSTILDIPVKARADAIAPGEYIVDIKTTSMPSGIEFFRQTLREYMYDLSAALYCQIAYDTYKKIHDFYWIVLSKADFKCEIYKASSATLSEGVAKYTQALVLYKQCAATGKWESSRRDFTTNGEYEVLEV